MTESENKQTHPIARKVRYLLDIIESNLSEEIDAKKCE